MKSFFALLLSLSSLFAQEVSRDGPKLSPFRGMRSVENGIEVQVADDTWFALEKVAGVDTATLLSESRRLCGDLQWKRITEDLPALLDAMGTKVDRTVDLEVRDLKTGAKTQMPGVAMSGENRRRLLEANNAAGGAGSATGPISPADALADLETLRELLDRRFAYRDLRNVDLDALLKDAAKQLDAQPGNRLVFMGAVDRVLRAFGDGHSRVDGLVSSGTAFLPFLVQEVEGGHVAFQPDRRALVDAQRPFVVAIDGAPIAQWLAAARVRATQGSAAMQARDSERLLRDLGDLRGDLGIGASREVTVTLRGATDEVTVTLPVARKRSQYGAWPRTDTRPIGEVGYLRIAEMQGGAAFLDGLDAAMQSFRTTKGLVIDVRGNGGGTRDALRRLAPYFLPKAGRPVVGNVAAVLLDGNAPAAVGALADRGLWPLEWDGWSGTQRDAIAAFVKTWKPSWKPTPGRFSPWHFLVLDRADNPKAFAYDKPVIVLIDRGCFSATDVFAAALGALPNVRLVGEATSGGSGRAKGHTLPKTGVRLQLSTMASYRPDGVLFEGNGVVPDVAVATQPSDLIGATDTVLQRALELLR